MNLDTTTNDQWQPAIADKPDGTKLFIGWYDRRNDPSSNSLIQTYGVIATLPITGSGSFAANFLVSNTNYPPVFTGLVNTNAGTFDPAYPPRYRNDGTSCPKFLGTYASHMGDYDTAVADDQYFYYTWGDKRDMCTNATGIERNKGNIRFVKISGP